MNSNDVTVFLGRPEAGKQSSPAVLQMPRQAQLPFAQSFAAVATPQGQGAAPLVTTDPRASGDPGVLAQPGADRTFATRLRPDLTETAPGHGRRGWTSQSFWQERCHADLPVNMSNDHPASGPEGGADHGRSCEAATPITSVRSDGKPSVGDGEATLPPEEQPTEAEGSEAQSFIPSWTGQIKPPGSGDRPVSNSGDLRGFQGGLNGSQDLPETQVLTESGFAASKPIKDRGQQVDIGYDRVSAHSVPQLHVDQNPVGSDVRKGLPWAEDEISDAADAMLPQTSNGARGREEGPDVAVPKKQTPAEGVIALEDGPQTDPEKEGDRQFDPDRGQSRKGRGVPIEGAPNLTLPMQARADEKALNPSFALPFENLHSNVEGLSPVEELPLFPANVGGVDPAAGRPALAGAAVPTGPAGAEIARHIANQIAVAAQPDGTTEIALDPEELGKVRLRLTGTETAMSILIIAERPETTELMRRHVDALAQEFREIGYTDLQFQFESGANDQQSSHDEGAPIARPRIGEVEHEQALQSRGLTRQDGDAGGLDLRL